MRNGASRRLLAVAVVCSLSVAALATSAAGDVHVAAPGRARTLLVLLRPSRGTATRAGRARVAAGQDAVVEEARAVGARVVARTTVPDVLIVRADPSAARALAANPLVEGVLPNSLIPGPTPPSSPLRAPGEHRAGTPAHAPCGTAAKPELDPEGLSAIDAEGPSARAYDGAGVKVAILADGLSPANPDLRRNAAYASAGSAKGTAVVATYRDFSGEGTGGPTDGEEAFGDAASIAAQGNEVYDLSRYVGAAHPLHGGCDIRIKGDAPGASLIALEVFGYTNEAYASEVVQAVNFAVAQGAQVLNESFGFNDFPSTSVDIVRAVDEQAVAAGVTVVVSSGDAGVTSTIGSPASDPDVLTVGASTTYRAYAQATYGGINALRDDAGYLDDNVSALSSGGVAEDGKTIDLMAPGDLGWSLCTRSDRFLGCQYPIQLFGGTSESSPLTAGAAADVIDAYEATHAGAAPTPALVMQLLTSTARDEGAPAGEQGAGLLDVDAAVRLATSAPGTTDASSAGGLLLGTSQVDLTGAPGSAQSATVSLTNTSASPTTVTLTTRALAAASATSGVASLVPSNRRPFFPDDDGQRDTLDRIPIHVAPGTARLQVAAAYRSFAFVQVSLFAPDGDLAAYSLPQGYADYANVEVAAPKAGTWIAAFFMPFGEPSVQLRWTATSWRFAADGTVSPATLGLAPGATGDVTLHETLPSSPGDGTLALVASSDGQVATVPVAVRTMIAVGPHGARFRGVLTGGNGRGGAPGQSNTYAFSVPPGEHDLDVGVALAANPPEGGQLLEAYLLDPSGDTQAVSSNVEIGDLNARYADLYVADPAAGDWLLVLDWSQPGAGVRTSVPFVCSVAFDEVSVSGDLPDAAATVVPSKGATYTLTVANKGVAPMVLTPDARLPGTTTLQVKQFLGVAATQVLPRAFGDFLLPTDVSSVEFATVSTVPATLQAQFYSGDPVLSPTLDAPFVTGSLSADSASATYTPPTGVPEGLWQLVPAEIGPFPATGERAGFVTMAAHVVMAPFDPAVSSTVPDGVKAWFTARRGARFTPMLVDPGKTGTLRVTFAPSGAPGTVVTGTLFLDGLDLGDFAASPLTAIPYEYTVGS